MIKITLSLVLVVSLSFLVAYTSTPVFASSNPYLQCPDCNDTSNIQQIPPVPITVTTDKPVYDHQSQILIIGHVARPYPGQGVAVKITSPSGNIVSTTQATLDSNGDFTTRVSTVGNIWFESGQYTVTVQQGDESRYFGQTTFQFIGSSLNSSSPASSLITASIDKSSYTYGDTITISGYVQSVVVGTPLTVQILDPTNNLVQVTQVDVVDPNGKYVGSIKITGTLWKLSGIYTIKVQYGPPNITAQTTFYFNAGTTIPSDISISTDKQSYVTNDMITITGTADPNLTTTTYLTGIPTPLVSKVGVTIRIINSAQNLISVAQVEVDNTGKFSKQITATGPLWQYPGLYTVNVIQGKGTPVLTQFWFNYDGGSIPQPTQPTQTPPPNPNPENNANEKSLDEILKQRMADAQRLQALLHGQNAVLNTTQQDIQNINQAKSSQTIAAEVNVGANQSETKSIDNNVSVQTTQNTPDSLGVKVSANNQTGPKVIVFNLAATTINVQNLKDLGVMYDGKLIAPAPNMDAILHAKPTDSPSFAIVVTQSGVQVLVLVPHFSTHTITITNMSKVIPVVPEFGSMIDIVLLSSIIGVIMISRKFKV